MDTRTFEITTTVRGEDVQAAKEQLQAILDDLRDQVPEAVMGEITTEPAPEERPKPLRYSEIHVN